MLNEQKGEQWLTLYEKEARWNLTDTTITPRKLSDILKYEPDVFDDIQLDYGDITGSDRLKKAILSQYATGTADNVTTTAGCINANQLVMDELISPEDKVVVFTPGYAQYLEYPKALGAQVAEVKLEDDYDVDFEQLEKQAEGAKLIILSNPDNPSGTVLTESELIRLAGIARKNDAWILCDEVYRGIGPDILPSISDLYEKGIATSSLAKAFGMPGLRIGWVKAARSLIDRLNIRRDYTMISTATLNDTLAAIVLEHAADFLDEHNTLRNANAQILKDWLETNPDFSASVPDYGLVCLLSIPDDDDVSWTTRLFESTGVLFIPGSFFGAPGKVRIGLGIDSEVLKAGLEQVTLHA